MQPLRIPTHVSDAAPRGPRLAVTTEQQTRERDETHPMPRIPPPYDNSLYCGRFYQIFDLCGRWLWQLVEEDKIPKSWSRNLIDKLTFALRMVNNTPEISLDDFVARLDIAIKERIPSKRSRGFKKLMKTDVMDTIGWISDKHGAKPEGWKPRGTPAPALNAKGEDQASRQSLSTSVTLGAASIGHDTPATGKSPAARQDARVSTVDFLQLRGDDSGEFQPDQSRSVDFREPLAPSAMDKATVRTSASIPVVSSAGKRPSRRQRRLANLTNNGLVTSSRKRPQMTDHLASEETPWDALYMAWLSQESARAKNQAGFLNDRRSELKTCHEKRAEVITQRERAQIELDAAHREVQSLAHEEQQLKLAVDSLRPIVDRADYPAQYRTAFESSEQLLRMVPVDKERAEKRVRDGVRQLRGVDRELRLLDSRIERLAGEIERDGEEAGQAPKEQRACDVLLKLVGAGVNGIASWDSGRLEALEALVSQADEGDFVEGEDEKEIKEEVDDE